MFFNNYSIRFYLKELEWRLEVSLLVEAGKFDYSSVSYVVESELFLFKHV